MNRLLFDPPEVYDLPLSYGSDIKVDFRNVIPGSDPALKDEIVMIGAHYDHEGARGGYVWHGADDNASGTTGVLEIARAFATEQLT